MTVSPRSSPHSPKPLLDVRMMLPLSYRAETRVKKAVAAFPVIGPDAELVHDQHLGRQVDASAFGPGCAPPGLSLEVLHQVVGPDEVGPLAMIYGPLSAKATGQSGSLPTPGGLKQQYVAGLGHEGQSRSAP